MIKKMFLFNMIIIMFIMVLKISVFAKDYLYVPVTNGVKIIDCDKDVVIKKIPLDDYVVTAQFSPDGKRYYVLGEYRRIYVIDTETNKLVDVYRFSTKLNIVTILSFAVSENNKYLYMICNIVKKKMNVPRLKVLPPQLVVFDVKKKKVIKNYTIPVSFCVFPIRKDPNHVILFGLDVFRLDLRNGKVKKIAGILHPDKPGEEVKNCFMVMINISPGDHGLFPAIYYTATGMGYYILDRNNGKIIKDLKGKDVWFMYSGLISPDKKYIYGIMDELIKVDYSTGSTVKAVRTKTGTCYADAITSDGKKVYVGPCGNYVEVYDADTLNFLGKIDIEGDGAVLHRLTK